ncbi:MAG: hypothetical protein FJX75_02975 [Armatimonadetes bacterium]|nr:hypothetical protein [Armatimonadota bacterium]
MPHSRRAPSKPLWKRVLLGCGIGCGSLLLLLVIVALIIFYKLTAVPPEVAHARRPSPPSAPGAPAQPQPEPPPFEVQRQEVDRALQTGQAANATYRLSEAGLNDLIAQNADPSAPVQNVRAYLGNGEVTVTGTGHWRGRQAYLTAVGRPQASAGVPEVRLSSVRIGTMGVPGSGVARMEAELNRALADWAAKNRYTVNDVSVCNGQLVMSVSGRPQ